MKTAKIVSNVCRSCITKIFTHRDCFFFVCFCCRFSLPRAISRCVVAVFFFFRLHFTYAKWQLKPCEQLIKVWIKLWIKLAIVSFCLNIYHVHVCAALSIRILFVWKRISKVFVVFISFRIVRENNCRSANISMWTKLKKLKPTKQQPEEKKLAEKWTTTFVKIAFSLDCEHFACRF